MAEQIECKRINEIFLIAIGMTGLAEFVYFVFWGTVFFPQGSLITKAVWMAVCGLGMGVVIGAAVVMFVEGRKNEISAIWYAAFIITIVGTACAILCGQLDVNFNYFGGRESPMVFVLVGLIPALLGGMLCGWLLYHQSGQELLERSIEFSLKHFK